MRKSGWLCRITLFLGVIAWCGACPVWAENIDPNDAGDQYAWSENAGWVNTEPLGQGGPGLTVTSSAVTGYAWAENVGWMSLSCENTSSCDAVNFGVKNDGHGSLSGYAWGENIGWISFSCVNTASCESVDYGVAVDPETGQFSGHAWGENVGWMSFQGQGPKPFKILTSWKPGLVEACEGNFDEDQDVDGSDLATFAADFGRTDCDNAPPCEGDFDKADALDGSDLATFAADFRRTDCP